GREDRGTLSLFVLLSHAGPRVGVNRVGSGDRGARVGEQVDAGARLFRDFDRVGNDVVLRRIALRRGNPNGRSQTGAGQKQRVRHVVAVADVRQTNSAQISK